MSYKAVSINGKPVKRIKLNGGLHWEKTLRYVPVLPDDTDKFPQTLTGYAAEEITIDHNWGASSTYKSSVYAKPVLKQEAVKLGHAYSNFGNSVSSFSDYEEGDIAIGYSADPAMTQALNIWFASEKPSSINIFKTWLAENPILLLYELYESDGSEWTAVRYGETYGYYNEATDVFVPVYGMSGNNL